jgi:hypothetical protein
MQSSDQIKLFIEMAVQRLDAADKKDETKDAVYQA